MRKPVNRLLKVTRIRLRWRTTQKRLEFTDCYPPEFGIEVEDDMSVRLHSYGKKALTYFTVFMFVSAVVR